MTVFLLVYGMNALNSAMILYLGGTLDRTSPGLLLKVVAFPDAIDAQP